MSYNLSSQQSAIINWVKTGTGSLEVKARAGCGKTTLLIEVVKTISQNNLGDVALMAYNKSIGDELKSKITNLGIDWKVATAGTVHSYGFSAWKKAAPKVEIDSDKVKKIIKSQYHEYFAPILKDQASLIGKCVSLSKQRAFGYLENIENDTAWEDLFTHFDLESDLEGDYQPSQIINAAKKILRMSFDMDKTVIDFDDMILAPLVHKARFFKKDWILVDESQDTNAARRALALTLLKPNGRMVSVGDDAQAIYGFTGADSDSMQQLRDATNAISLPLTLTYRCPKAIVAEANKFVPDLIAHESATEGSIRSITYEAMNNEVFTADDVILCRNVAPLVSTALNLLGRGIACQVEGRDIAASLIKLSQRFDVTDLNELSEALDSFLTVEVARLTAKEMTGLVAVLTDQVDCLKVIMDRCRSQGNHTLQCLSSTIMSMFGDSDKNVKKVLTLSSIHRSKGREWKRVFALGRHTLIPSKYARLPWQLTQENNLEYVMVTRVQQELIDIAMPAKE